MTGDVRLDWRAEAAGGSVVPAELALVKAFLNSVDIEEGTDSFETVETMHAWLVDRGLLGVEASPTESERRGLIEFREAVREVVDAHGAAIPSAALATVAAAARTAPLVVALDGTGRTDLRPAGRGLDAVIARLLADVASAQRIGTWRDLRICRRDVCRWAFYDASRNHSGIWCTMSICGNRVKSANLRRRRSGARPGSAQRRKVLPQVPSQTT
jgi:predicted RNA-binding Zn ribbon-like protein